MFPLAAKTDAARAADYRDALHLVDDVANNWTELRQGDDGRLILVKRGGKNPSVVIELARNDGGYYDVVTAAPLRDRYLNGRKLLLERAAAPGSTPEGVPFQPRNRSVSETISAGNSEVNFGPIGTTWRRPPL